MDRSLKFFLGSLNNINNADINTGLPLETHEVQTNIYVNDENQQTVNDEFVINRSLQGENIINYSGNSPLNDFEPYLTQPEEQSDISLTSIINWTQNNHPALELKPDYFVYLKYFRSYPANRLMILRRFNAGISSDLFTSKITSKPISTLVTYVKEDEMPVKITFNEKWKKIESEHTFFEVLQDVIGIDFDSVPGVSNVIKKTSQSPLAQDLFNKLKHKIGLASTENLYGDPDIIYEAMIRDVSGKEVASGLESDISITFETDYVFNEINGVDAKAGMLDVIANVVKMGTSPEKFYLSGKGSKVLDELLGNFREGEGGEILTKIVSFFKDILNETIDSIKNAITGGTQTTNDQQDDSAGAKDARSELNMLDIPGIGSSILKRRYKRYKWQLTGLLGTMGGSATAPWHITIGNPKSPWFSVGNLVIDKVELTPNSNLGYSDFFTELNVKITLKSARSYGSSGLTSLFNNGKGRIYDDPSNIKKINKEKNDLAPLFQDDVTTTTPDNQPEDVTDGDNINQIPNINPFATTDDFIDNNLPTI